MVVFVWLDVMRLCSVGIGGRECRRRPWFGCEEIMPGILVNVGRLRVKILGRDSECSSFLTSASGNVKRKGRVLVVI